MIKIPKIIERPTSQAVYLAALQLNLTPLQATLVAKRLSETDSIEQIVFPKLKHIQHPSTLKNSLAAAHIISDAIAANGLIVLATDYDTDGVTSAWVAMTALVHYFNVPAHKVVHIIGERKAGYGITDEVCDRILALNQPVSLVISADQGSSDEPRIARLKAAGIAVCVTDHHQMPIDGAPQSAVCTVNPQQAGCDYDKTVAGCFVIFLVMTQVRQVLIERGLLAADSPSLKALALNVALGTIADSVSLKSPNNRAIVQSGLQFINQFTVPAWQAVKQLNDNQGEPFNAEFLAFQVATRINAASRVSDVTTAFNFLNAAHLSEAQRHLQQLDDDNQDRRHQQQAMLAQAQDLAQALYHNQKYSLALKLQGNAGIQGIIATRIGEAYGLPCVAMTDLKDGYLAGSGRGIVKHIDLRHAFQWMADQEPGLFKSMGGHAGAAGCMIKLEHYDIFSALFEQAIKLQIGDQPPVPIIETDGQLSEAQLTPNLINELAQLEPYGREWPQPLFNGEFEIVEVKAVGQTQTHLSFKLKQASGKWIQAIYFNAKQSAQDPIEFTPGERIRCVYQASLNRYNGRVSLQLRLQWAAAM
ncbi:single-stranded-DNA-specific exonuclease RecJ [Thiomicrorhabdus aquaedulcis]|uniref:single-stranded-DNA-specific exonuclease RecJ n=1 Tax=Thiomicrorhabdus aquaedulcis TaxID=2211106 RepID=UPI000FDC92AE|nr:DHH family phosphoesterase [Thiomicrorhabdus aquaedulcis]